MFLIGPKQASPEGVWLYLSLRPCVTPQEFWISFWISNFFPSSKRFCIVDFFSKTVNLSRGEATWIFRCRSSVVQLGVLQPRDRFGHLWDLIILPKSPPSLSWTECRMQAILWVGQKVTRGSTSPFLITTAEKSSFLEGWCSLFIPCTNILYTLHFQVSPSTAAPVLLPTPLQGLVQTALLEFLYIF